MFIKPNQNLNEERAAEVLQKALFPQGTDFDENHKRELIEYYKILCQSTEQMATRRQTVNSYFLSINSLLLAGTGFFYKEALELFSKHHSHAHHLTILAGAVALIGLIIDWNWSALIRAYSAVLQRQLQVLEGLERHLVAAIYTAQFELNRQNYKSLSTIEVTVANTFALIFCSCIVVSFLLYFCWKLN